MLERPRRNLQCFQQLRTRRGMHWTSAKGALVSFTFPDGQRAVALSPSLACSTFCRTHEILTLVATSFKSWRNGSERGMTVTDCEERMMYELWEWRANLLPICCQSSHSTWINLAHSNLRHCADCWGYFHCILQQQNTQFSLVDMNDYFYWLVPICCSWTIPITQLKPSIQPGLRNWRGHTS